MTSNKRIFLNIIATYGRSLYAMMCGIFTGRWVLMALGEVDYGLYGVIGGLVVFITFINSVLGWSLSRFYALSIGRAQSRTGFDDRNEECQRWFSIALLIHTLIPLFLVIVGYPIGHWAISHWLVIPPDRMHDCQMLFGFVCFSAFVGMINVPFTALYTAKQYIAELTVYSFITTTCNLIFVAYMSFSPGDWMLKYGIFMCALNIVPQLVICIRGWMIFDECVFRIRYCLDYQRIRELFNYSFWGMLEVLGTTLQSQGVAVLVNRNFGASLNASMTIANTVKGHASNLASAMQGAFSPAITTEYGRGDYDRARSLAYRSCRLSLLLALIFFVPLVASMQDILVLWLKAPPAYTAELCYIMIFAWLARASTSGFDVLTTAAGYIVLKRLITAGACVVSVIVAVILFPIRFHLGFFWSVITIEPLMTSIGNVIIARRRLSVSARKWFVGIIVPMTCVVLLSVSAGCLVGKILSEAFIRLICVCFLSVVVYLASVWALATEEDKEIVKLKVAGLLGLKSKVS